MEYLAADFLNDSLMVFIRGHDKTAARLALSCDVRIPRHAQGYVAQLISDAATREVQLDCIRQLRRYVTITAHTF